MRQLEIHRTSDVLILVCGSVIMLLGDQCCATCCFGHWEHDRRIIYSNSSANSNSQVSTRKVWLRSSITTLFVNLLETDVSNCNITAHAWWWFAKRRALNYLTVLLKLYSASFQRSERDLNDTQAEWWEEIFATPFPASHSALTR